MVVFFFHKLPRVAKLLAKKNACFHILYFAFVTCVLFASASLHRYYCSRIPPSTSKSLERRYGPISSGLLINSLLSEPVVVNHAPLKPTRSTVPTVDRTLYCNRDHQRTDVCVVKGDVRVRFAKSPKNSTHAAGSYEVIQVVNAMALAAGHDDGDEAAVPETLAFRDERIRPYTRKWEESVMKTIDEVVISRRFENVVSTGPTPPKCDVVHKVPAVVFSTGGYTGNVYHEFNDGIIPLFLTAARHKGEVVLVILEYHNWWMMKYREIVERITNHKIVDYANDKRVHCFEEVTVGLKIQDELTISGDNPSMNDFQDMLRSAFSYKQAKFSPDGTAAGKRSGNSDSKPKLLIISRSHPRAILNQRHVVAMASKAGFTVQVLKPRSSTELAEMYWALQSCDVMLGVHGAAMTHLLFMRPGATFIQVVPLGTAWAAETYYGEPARKLGLNYVAYNVTRRESSLSRHYAVSDPILSDPESVNKMGWWETKRIYLETQDVTLSLPRLSKLLRSVHSRIRKQQQRQQHPV